MKTSAKGPKGVAGVLIVASGVLGFGSFLTYLGYGYLDTWHGTASLVLLPAFLTGLILSRSHATVSLAGWLNSTPGRGAPAILRRGRWGLLATAAGICLAGLVILYIGATDVFVREDLMQLTRTDLDAINQRLVPLIAHDRAGFGGGLATTGLLLLICAWYAPPTRAFHQAVLVAGIAGFGCAIGTHFIEGYLNPLHLGPAFAGAALFAVSIGFEIAGSARLKDDKRR